MKSWQQRERAQLILSKEIGYVRKPHGGRLRIALAFPNTYYVGMSSLGFQTVYRLFNDLDDVVCERTFLPAKQELQAQLASGTPLLTLESQTPVSEPLGGLRERRVVWPKDVSFFHREVSSASNPSA